MKYTGTPVMKSALRAYESAAIAAHEIPPGGGTKAARCAAYSAFTGVKAEFANSRFYEQLRQPVDFVYAGFAHLSAPLGVCQQRAAYGYQVKLLRGKSAGQ